MCVMVFSKISSVFHWDFQVELRWFISVKRLNPVKRWSRVMMNNPIRLKSLYLVTKATPTISIRPETKRTYVDVAWSEYHTTIVIRYWSNLCNKVLFWLCQMNGRAFPCVFCVGSKLLMCCSYRVRRCLVVCTYTGSRLQRVRPHRAPDYSKQIFLHKNHWQGPGLEP